MSFWLEGDSGIVAGCPRGTLNVATLNAGGGPAGTSSEILSIAMSQGYV